MKRGLILLLVLSLGLNAGLLYKELGRHGHNRGDRHPEASPEKFITRRLDRMTERYDLNDEQRANMEAVLREFVPAVMEQHRRVSEARDSVLSELGSSAVDRTVVLERTMELNVMQARLDSLVTESMLREVGVLTAPQRALYTEHMQRDHRRPRGDKR